MAELQRRHIPGLDGIRAIAFLVVYFSHMGLGHSYVGGQGVAVFFFLSGYLITTLMRVEAEETGSVSIKSFYIRRIFRIFPTLYVTVLFAILLHFVNLNPSIDLPALLSVVFYYSNYFMIDPNHASMGGLSGTWSLSVEEHFYLVFPLIFLAIWKRPRGTQAQILGAICFFCFVWRCVLGYWLHVDKPRIYMGTDTRFDSILLGSILALTLNPVFSRDRIPSWFKARPGQWAAFGVATALLIDHVPVVNRSVSFTILGLALFPVFWYVILHSRERGARWLQNRRLRIIGRWSYSLYLVHQMMIAAVELATHRSGPIPSILAIAPCLLYAWAVEKFIERPSYRLRNAILRKTAKAPDRAASATLAAP